MFAVSRFRTLSPYPDLQLEVDDCGGGIGINQKLAQKPLGGFGRDLVDRTPSEVEINSEAITIQEVNLDCVLL